MGNNMTNEELEKIASDVYHNTDPSESVNWTIDRIKEALRTVCDFQQKEIDRLLKRNAELCDESRERMEANCDSVASFPRYEEFSNWYENKPGLIVTGKECYDWLRLQIKTVQSISDEKRKD